MNFSKSELCFISLVKGNLNNDNTFEKNRNAIICSYFDLSYLASYRFDFKYSYIKFIRDLYLKLINEKIIYPDYNNNTIIENTIDKLLNFSIKCLDIDIESDNHKSLMAHLDNFIIKEIINIKKDSLDCLNYKFINYEDILVFEDNN